MGISAEIESQKNTDDKQRSLLEFFELLEKPTWQITLHDIIRKKQMDIWDVDVKLLAQEYMQRLTTEFNINNIVTGLLICSILLKYKSKRMGLKELEGYIEEEIEEVKDGGEEKVAETIQTLQENAVPLDEFQKNLEKIVGEKHEERKKYEKKPIEIVIPTTNEDFATTARKLLDHIMSLNKDVYAYEELKELNLQNNLFMILLYLNDDEKLKLQQKEMYGELKVKFKKEDKEN